MSSFPNPHTTASRIITFCVVCICFSGIRLRAQNNHPLFRAIAFFTAKKEDAHTSFAHEANDWFRVMALRYNFVYDSTQDWNNLNPGFLSRYQVVLFLNANPDSLNQQEAFRKYMEQGGAWMGFHIAGSAIPAAGSNRFEEWYHQQFIGAGYKVGNSWKPVPAILRVENRDHPANRHLPETFQSAASEWYRWSNDIRTHSDITILLSVDSSSFPLGTGPGQDQIWHHGYYPIAWTHTRYRMVYLNMGHNDLDPSTHQALSSSFDSSMQNQFLLDALLWLGSGKKK